MGGACVGNTSNCSCLPTFGDTIKVTSMQVGDGGNWGESLDVDQKPSTCAPQSNCSGGYDNTLSILAALVNPAFNDQIQVGTGILLVEFRGVDSSSTFELALYGGEVDPANAQCNIQNSKCDYLVDGDMVDSEACTPLSTLPAVWSGNTFEAGSATSTFPFKAAIGQDTYLIVDVHMVRISGYVTWSGDQVQTFNGVLAGALRKDELIAAISATPSDQLPVDKTIVVGLIQFLPADIDTDNDGVKDALSIGIKIQAIDGEITGLY
jgi:hypothetical protein